MIARAVATGIFAGGNRMCGAVSSERTSNGGRSADRGGIAAGFGATNSGEHRKTGQLRNAADAVGAGSGVDCGGARDWRRAGVDQGGVRALFQRLRRLPGSEDRQLHRRTDGADSEGHRNHQCLCGPEGHRRGECEAHGAGDRALRFAQQRHARREWRRAGGERRWQRNGRQPGMRARAEQDEVSRRRLFF